jgi:hypothetical protein
LALVCNTLRLHLDERECVSSHDAANASEWSAVGRPSKALCNGKLTFQ